MRDTVYIHSWNMQGGGNEKIGYIQRKHYGDNIILLCQESGSPDNTGFIEGATYGDWYCVASKPDVYAKNQRCTTSVLVTRELTNKVVNKGCFYTREISSLLCRPVVHVTYKDVHIFTFHATASKSLSHDEVKTVLTELYKLQSQHQKWILMGDFNVEPSEFLPNVDMMTMNRANQKACRLTYRSGTSSRGIDVDCYISFSTKPTQGAKGERINNYDYAFLSVPLMSSKICGRARLYNYKVESGNITISDHNMTGMILRFNPSRYNLRKL